MPAFDQRGRARYVLTRRVDERPSVAGGLYEAALSIRSDSQSTIYHRLGALAYLLTWAEDAGIDAENRVLSGRPLSSAHVNSFAFWLERRFSSTGLLTRKQRRTFNGIIDAARLTERWFLNLGHQCEDPTARALEIEKLVSGQSVAWDQTKRNVGGSDEAPDLSDGQLTAIETLLQTSANANTASHSDQRTYLIWRLIIEYGLRIGEILALRIQDCPQHLGEPLKVVRIEDRDHSDPRGIYAPRPKTLGRSLGAIVSPSTFPSLIWEYVASHRYTLKQQPDGSQRKSPFVPHPFLIVNRTGEPISMGTANQAAISIAKAVGIPFHWHLVRHAFFNRAYADIADLTEETDRISRMDDLVYWGGWSDPASIRIYTNRARRLRAEKAKVAWQSGGLSWNPQN